MKLLHALLASFAIISPLVSAQDGPSGDGNCDPCDETCAIFTKRDNSNVPRMLEYNDTSPFEPGEGVRWRKPTAVAEISDRFAKRAPTILRLEFNCVNLPEICNNICYGLYCAGKALPQTLTINRAGCPAARRSNACGARNPNYCSVRTGFPPGYSCDEYPFASTIEGLNAGGRTATRCVPRSQNSAQGSNISGLYRHGQGTGGLPDGTQFFVDIGNPGAPGAGYCLAYPGGGGSCNNPVGDPNSALSQR